MAAPLRAHGVIPRGCCASWGAAAPGEGGNGFASGRLLRDEQARAEHVEADLDDAYATLRTGPGW